MTVVLVILGLILLLAGSGWFSGAATVGVILLIVGAIGLVIQFVVLGAAAKQIGSVNHDLNRRIRL